MQCFRCSHRDFKIKIYSFRGFPYLECSHCFQGFLIKTGKVLVPAEIQDMTNRGKYIQSECQTCNAERYINEAGKYLINNPQKCNLCVLDEPEYTLVPTKLSWEEFLNK